MLQALCTNTVPGSVDVAYALYRSFLFLPFSQVRLESQ